MIIKADGNSPARNKVFCAIAIIAGSLCGSSLAYSAELEEIIVTATKRAETLMEVPVSVAAISGDKISDAGITDVADLATFIPNLQYSDSTLVPNFFMRGMGSGATHNIEQSVGTFVDDVYMSRGIASTMAFFDIAAVEVLRGPQGTLFGKNTSVGALITHTGNPTESFEGRISTTLGDYSTVGGSAGVEVYVSGPLSDTVSARLAVKYKETDGYIENLADGPDGADKDDLGVRLKFNWDISENTTAQLKLEHAEYQTEGLITSDVYKVVDPVVLAVFNERYADIGGFKEGLDWKTYHDCSISEQVGFCSDHDQEQQTYALTINHEFDSGTLTSISAIQKIKKEDRFLGTDQGVLGGVMQATRDEEFESFNQEIKFTSASSDTFDYIVGIFYEDAELRRDPTSNFDFGLIPDPAPGPKFLAVGRAEPWQQDTESVSIFGQARWQFDEDWTAVIGGRYVDEEKSFSFERYFFEYLNESVRVIPPVGFLGQTVFRPTETRSETKFTPSFTLRWDGLDNTMAYYSYGVGHKTGGFTDRGINDTTSDITYDPEVVTSHEIGAKSTWLDGTLETNIALFYMSIEDMQLAAVVPGSTQFIVNNAAESTSYGVEFDWRLGLSDNWTMGGNLAYLNATYDDFEGATCSRPQANGTVPGCAPDAFGNMVQDLSGETLPQAPEFESNLFLEYSAADVIAGWSLDGRVDVSFSSEMWMQADLDDYMRQPSYSQVHASVKFTSPGEQFSIGLIGRNLTEEEVMNFALGTPGPLHTYYAALKPPRELAVQLNYNF